MNLKKIVLSVSMLALLFVITGCGKKFTVTFNSDGGTSVRAQEVKKNEKAIEPDEPTKEGYIFLYWELDENEYDFNSKITKNITLVAKYEEYSEESFTVTFDSNGGSTMGKRIVKKNEILAKPTDPVKEGYKFLYWELDEKEYDFSEAVKRNMTLKAIWEKVEETKEEYTVTFDSNGGTSVSSKIVKEGAVVVKPANPTRSGYTFDGWYLNDAVYNFNSPVTKNITLVAKWKESNVTKYTVTFNSNGGSAVISQNINSGSKAVQPANPTRSGYTFDGWYLNNVVYNFNNSVTSNITLVAKWKEVIVQDVYTIESADFQIGSPQVKVFVKKNGTVVSAIEVLSSTEIVIGDVYNEFNVILADRSDYGKISKAKLNDGTIVNITK